MHDSLPVTFTHSATGLALVLGVAAALLVVAAGLAWRGRREYAVWSAALGLAVGILLGGGLATTRVELGPDGVQQTTYVPLGKRVIGFRFDEVDSITLQRERRGGGEDNTLWILHGHDGDVRTLNPGMLWDLHRAEIVRAFSAYRDAQALAAR